MVEQRANCEERRSNSESRATKGCLRPPSGRRLVDEAAVARIVRFLQELME